MKNTILVSRILSIVIFSLLTGCGGNGWAGSSFSSVNQVSFRDKTIVPGAQTTLRVDFDPAANVTDYDSDGDPHYRSEAFALTVFLPDEVSLIPEGSRLSDSLIGDVLFGNPDPKQPIEEGRCSDGRIFQRYFFDEDELSDALNTSMTSIYMKIDMIIPASANGKSAGANISWSKNACDESPDESTQIVIQAAK